MCHLHATLTENEDLEKETMPYIASVGSVSGCFRGDFLAAENQESQQWHKEQIPWFRRAVGYVQGQSKVCNGWKGKGLPLHPQLDSGPGDPCQISDLYRTVCQSCHAV